MKILTHPKSQKDVIAKIKSAISENIIAQNLYDFYYVFKTEKDLRYSSELLYYYLKKEPKQGSLVIEEGFYFKFLLEILAEKDEDYKVINNWGYTKSENDAIESLRQAKDVFKFVYTFTLGSFGVISNE